MTTQVFAASDRPAVITSSNGSLVDSNVNLEDVNHMCSFNSISFPGSVAIVKKDVLIIGSVDDFQLFLFSSVSWGTPMKLDNNYYVNLMNNKGLLIVDQQLYADSRTRPYVKKMAKSQEYFFKYFSWALTILSENNPLTDARGEIRRQCSLRNKLHTKSKR